MTQKIFSINPNDKKLPLLFPKMQMTHTENLCGVDKSINVLYSDLAYLSLLQVYAVLRDFQKKSFETQFLVNVTLVFALPSYIWKCHISKKEAQIRRYTPQK